MEDPVVPFDLVRMFLGTDPPLFYLEIAFRICVVYLYALVLIRWVGGRGIAQMSTVEFLLVIALGSAVGDAMFYPEVPILHAVLVITGVVVINKLLDAMIFRFRWFEKALDGRTAEIVRDGEIVGATMRQNNVGRSELFEGLREQGIRNLGELRAAYLESSGTFTVFHRAPPVPGLPVEPPWDVAPPPIVKSGEMVPAGTRLSCCLCGHVLPQADTAPAGCPTCHGVLWTPAVLVSDRKATGS